MERVPVVASDGNTYWISKHDYERGWWNQSYTIWIGEEPLPHFVSWMCPKRLKEHEDYIAEHHVDRVPDGTIMDEKCNTAETNNTYKGKGLV